MYNNHVRVVQYIQEFSNVRVLCYIVQTKVILVRDWLMCQTLSLSYSSKHSSNWFGRYPLARIL